jgi:hypothetical protein
MEYGNPARLCPARPQDAGPPGALVERIGRVVRAGIGSGRIIRPHPFRNQLFTEHSTGFPCLPARADIYTKLREGSRDPLELFSIMVNFKE